MGYAQFNEKKEKLLAELDKLCKEHNGTKIADLIADCAGEICAGKFRISIFGGFSNGKSTLLNALMGFDKEIMVVDELASTAAITSICFPDSEETENTAIVYFNAPDKEPEAIPLEKIRDYSAKSRGADGNIDNSEVEDTVKEVRLFVRSRFLENGVEITDTPGFNSVYEKHTEITKSIVGKSDATIFLFNYEQAGTQTDFSFISLLQENLNKAFLLINKIDLAFNDVKCDDNIDCVCSALRHKIESQNVSLGGKQVFPISARYAFMANGSPHGSLVWKEKMEKSRFENFTSALEKYLCSEEFESEKLLHPIERLKKALTERHDKNKDIISAFKGDVTGLEEKLNAIEDEIKAEEKNASDICRALAKNIKGIFSTYSSKISDESEKITNEIMNDIDKTMTAYAIQYRLENGGWEKDIYDKLTAYWNRLSGKISGDITDVVNEVLESSNRPFDGVPEKIAEAVNVRLDLSHIVFSDAEFKVDFTAYDEEREELERLRENLKEKSESINKLRNNMGERERAIREYDELKRQISDCRNKIDENLEKQSQCRGIMITKEVVEERKRKGFIGGIGNFLFGAKREKHNETYMDSTDADKQRALLGEHIANAEKKQEALKRERDAAAKIIDGSYGIDDMLEEAQEERQSLRKGIEKRENDLEKKRDEMEDAQVQLFRDEMKNKIQNEVTEFCTAANSALSGMHKNITPIAKRVVETNNSTLDALREKADALRELQFKTESERSNEINEREAENAVISAVYAAIKNIEKI